MSDNLFGTEYMQLTGKHFMGANLKSESLDPETVNKMKEMEETSQLEMTENLLKSNEGTKNCDNYELQATGFTVIFKPYDKNPYRRLKTTASGIIYGFDAHGQYKSNETGEYEDSEVGMGWGCAVSVGPECKYIKVGDDICYRNYVVPVPFDNNGYCAISEQNIVCKTVKKV